MLGGGHNTHHNSPAHALSHVWPSAGGVAIM